MRRAGVTFVLFCAAATAAGVGCARRHTPARVTTRPAPATKPSADGGAFDRPNLGVRLEWPAGWGQRASRDFVLLLGKPAENGTGGAASISLDVPQLPPHIPGLIPIGSVRGGYLDDLRKETGALKTTDLPSPPVPSAAARLVRSTWTDSAGQGRQETALLMVHADRVYILRARSLTTDENGARAAFDEIVRSLKWTR